MEPVCIGGAMISDVKHVPQANDAQQLMRDREHLRLLLQVNNALVSHLDLHELLRAISDALGRLIQHDYSSLCLYDEGAREFRVHALEFATGRGLIREEVVFKAEGSPAGEAFSKRQPLVVDNLGTHQFPNDVTGWLLAEGIKSACWLPLVRGQRCFGALCIGNRRPSTIPREELPLLTEVVNQVAIAVENALAFRQISEFKDRLSKEKDYLEDEIRAEYDYEEMVGRSPEWRRLLEQIETVAPTDATVLILGETGTGKELIARAIHNRSPRRERTMVKVNCASVPTGLLESELFGHEKGAFTGAISQYIGRFELAHKGTILLDEIGDIPLELQPKLLRALQERQFERLGSTRTITVDPRVIASTNHDLRELVRRREFRDDLYYRLNVFPIVVPPLRQRRADIPLLVRYFVHKYGQRMRKPIGAIPAAVMERLVACDWPGNVRELENAIERAIILSRNGDLPIGELQQGNTSIVPLETAERDYVLNALRGCHGVIGGPNGAANKLGLKRTTLNSRMRKLGISRHNL
jgi:formate hydrogenlyase transcriptional activator